MSPDTEGPPETALLQAGALGQKEGSEACVSAIFHHRHPSQTPSRCPSRFPLASAPRCAVCLHLHPLPERRWDWSADSSTPRPLGVLCSSLAKHLLSVSGGSEACCLAQSCWGSRWEPVVPTLHFQLPWLGGRGAGRERTRPGPQIGGRFLPSICSVLGRDKPQIRLGRSFAQNHDCDCGALPSVSAAASVWLPGCRSAPVNSPHVVPVHPEP